MNIEKACIGGLFAITLFAVIFSLFVLNGLSVHIGSFEELKQRANSGYCHDQLADDLPSPKPCLADSRETECC